MKTDSRLSALLLAFCTGVGFLCATPTGMFSRAAAADPADSSALSQGNATLLGIEGKGSKFVYVFDRSGSMGIQNNKPLDRAKTELLRSIDALNDLQQFYIIFYNHEQKTFQIDPSGKRLIFATDDNKRLARQFVGSIEAGGGTKHAEALLLALRMHPDVIFMLTDGDPPDDLTPEELDRVQKENTAGTIINVIQISPPDTAHENLLVRLAQGSGGRHVYIDFNKRPEAAAAKK